MKADSKTKFSRAEQKRQAIIMVGTNPYAYVCGRYCSSAASDGIYTY
jgi:hypothetical protein